MLQSLLELIVAICPECVYHYNFISSKTDDTLSFLLLVLGFPIYIFFHHIFHPINSYFHIIYSSPFRQFESYRKSSEKMCRNWGGRTAHREAEKHERSMYRDGHERNSVNFNRIIYGHKFILQWSEITYDNFLHQEGNLPEERKGRWLR